jgi:predicted nucleic acid-binding protein
VSRYVDASVAIKWFLPETNSEAALRPQHSNHRLHAPAFVMLELGNVLAKKIRRGELTQEEGKAILKDLKHIPLQQHPDIRLFRPAYALAEVVSGSMVTEDRKFYDALAKRPYARVRWVEELPQAVRQCVNARTWA